MVPTKMGSNMMSSLISSPNLLSPPRIRPWHGYALDDGHIYRPLYYPRLTEEKQSIRIVTCDFLLSIMIDHLSPLLSPLLSYIILHYPTWLHEDRSVFCFFWLEDGIITGSSDGKLRVVSVHSKSAPGRGHGRWPGRCRNWGSWWDELPSGNLT